MSQRGALARIVFILSEIVQYFSAVSVTLICQSQHLLTTKTRWVGQHCVVRSFG